MIYLSILIVGITFLVYYYFSRTLNYWRDKKVIGPKPVAFFGNLKESALRNKHVGMVYKEIYDEFPDEKVIGIFRMTTPTLIIRDLNIIKQILIKDFKLFPDRGIEFSKFALGDNLFHCDSKTWQALRSELTPLFTSGKLRNMFDIFVNHADQLVNYLETICVEQQEQELHQYFQKYTMSTIMSASFGLNVDLYSDKNDFIEMAGYFIFKSTYAAEIDMLIPNIWRKVNLSLYNKLVNKFSYEVIQTVVKQRDEVPTSKNDLIDTFLTLKKEGTLNEMKQLNNEKEAIIEITEHIMAGQVFIFFAAGFGNNSLSLSYTMFQLAQNPDAQEKLIQEIDEVIEKNGGHFTYDTIKEMPYLEKVYSEILRMNPLTNSIQRSANHSYTIPGTDLSIEKGTTVIISPYAIHRDEKFYLDPDKFDPERFSPENSANRHPCVYLPFGVGPRSCLGRQMAKLQYAVAVVKFLSKFRVEPSEKTKIIEDYDPMCTLLATKGGIHVNIVQRKV